MPKTTAVTAALKTQFAPPTPLVILSGESCEDGQRLRIRLHVVFSRRIVGYGSTPEDGNAAVAEIAPTGHDANFGILDLPRAGLAAQLPYRFHDVTEPEQMALRQQPAMRVDRQPAAEFDAAIFDEGSALAACR